MNMKKLNRQLVTGSLLLFASVAGATANASGEDVVKLYKENCFTCHGTGLPGAPQLGNTEQWAPRIAKGKDVLQQHALEGFIGASDMLMPPKGGNPSLSDEEVLKIVNYMISVATSNDNKDV